MEERERVGETNRERFIYEKDLGVRSWGERDMEREIGREAFEERADSAVSTLFDKTKTC